MLPPIIILGALLWGCSSDPDPLFSSADSDGPDAKPDTPDVLATRDSIDDDGDFVSDAETVADSDNPDLPEIIPPEVSDSETTETSDSTEDTPDQSEINLLPPDNDGDNYYDCSSPAEELAVLIAGGLCGDCDDANPNTYPGAKEYWDGKNNDCGGKALNLKIDACEIVGENSDHRFAMGDVDGDGVDDLVVGNPSYQAELGFYEGLISIFFGGSTFCSQGGKLYSTDAAVHMLGGCGWGFGDEILVTDINGDGYDEIFGSGVYNNGLGGGQCGDGNGESDDSYLIMKGRPKGQWQTFYDFKTVYNGSDENDLVELDAAILSGAGGVQRAKDIDGDGVDELVFTRADKAKLEIIPLKDYGGIQSIASLAQSEGHQVFNTIPDADSIRVTMGDYNGDGFGDVATTKINNQFEDIFVLYGQKNFPAFIDIADLQTMKQVNYKILRAGSFNASLGAEMTSGHLFGHFSDQGLPVDDLVISASTENTPSSFAGRVYALSGLSLSALSSGATVVMNNAEVLPLKGVIINSAEAESWLGTPVVAGGDFDGDGYDDLVTGAVQLNGTPWVHSFFTGAVLTANGGKELSIYSAQEFVAGPNPPKLSGTVVCSGDLNHDGFDDCIFASNSGSDYLLFGKGND